MDRKWTMYRNPLPIKKIEQKQSGKIRIKKLKIPTKEWI